MLRAIKRPREEISANAPRLIQIQINPEKIGLVIGPGGKTIRRLQDETGAKIDIEDSGIVTLSSLDAAGAEAARDKIQAMTEGVQVGRIYEGRVTSIKDFGAFVEILPGKDGLVHISELSDGYVSSVTDICRVGDPMLVKVIAVDDQDRVKLSRKAALAERGEPDELRQGPPRLRAARRRRRRRPRRPAAAGGPRRPRRRRRRRRRRRPRPRRATATDGRSARPGLGRAIAPALRPAPLARSGRSSRDPADPTSMADPHRRLRPRPASLDRDAGPIADSGRRPIRPTTHEINRRLRAQYAEIAQLAGGLAHEIRNPLSTMQLNLDLLAEDFQEPETPRDRRVLQKIERLRREVAAAPGHPRGLPPLRPGPGPPARAGRPQRGRRGAARLLRAAGGDARRS